LWIDPILRDTIVTKYGAPNLLAVVEQAEDVVVGEFVAAFEEVEFDGKGEAGDSPPS